MKTQNKCDFLGNGELNLLGYAELDIGSTTASGHVILESKIDAFDFGYNTFVAVVIPVTVQVKFSLEGNIEAAVTYDWANATFIGTLDASVAGTLKAFGGVGVNELIGVGAYGSAKLEAVSRLIGIPKQLQSIDLTGELGLKAYIANQEYERAFAYNTWHLYSANEIQSVRMIRNGNNKGHWHSEYDASQYTPTDLSYLESESEWLGDVSASPVLFRSSAV